MSKISDITNNVPNSTISTYEVNTTNESYHLVVTANDGYVFNDDIVFEYYDQNGDYSKDNLTLSADKKTAEITNNDYYPDFGEELNGTTVSGGKTVSYPLKIDLTNLEATGQKESYSPTDTINITVSPVAGYEIDSENLPYLQYQDDDGDNETIPFTQDGDNAKLSRSISSLPYATTGNKLTVYGVGKKKESPVITYKMSVDVSNMTATGVKDSYSVNDIIEVTLTPLAGYIIKEVPYLSYQDDNGDFVEVKFTVSDNVATLVKPVRDLEDATTGNNLSIYGTAEQEKPAGTSKGLINIYSVTLEQLSDFAKARFFVTKVDAEGITTAEQIDLGIFVKGVRQIFYPVKTSGTPNIVCGNYDTGVKALNVDESIVNVDLGSIDIPFKNRNTTDYNSKLSLFLPFVGFVSLDTDLIGNTLHITCEIDIENGKGVYKLYNGESLFEVKDVEPYYNIIFRTSDGVTFDNDSDSKYLYGLKPFVIYTWYEDQTTGNNNVDSSQPVSSLTGFNKCDTVTGLSTTNKTLEEYNEIIRLLKTGFTL